VSRTHSSRERRALLAAIFFAPFAATQWNQQANGLALLALVGARTWLDREESCGGAALGLSAAIKPLAVLPLAWLALTRRWRAAAAGSLVLVAAFAVAIPSLGIGGMARSLARVFEVITRARVEVYGANISVAGIWTRLIEPGRPNSTVRIALGDAILGVSIFVSLLPRLRPSQAVDLLVTASLLAVNTSWVHHSAIAFPLVASLETTPMVAVLVLYLVADRGVSAGWHTGDFMAPFGTLASAAGTAALMILWLVALSRALAGPRTPPPLAEEDHHSESESERRVE
jgi:glycosyl transferase family 87